MYIALRAMQVQGVDGNTRQVKPGDEIPEAEGWKTREAYVRRGWICLEGQPLNDGATARMVRAIRDRDKELTEQADFIDRQNQEIRDRGDRISQLASELEEAGIQSVPLATSVADTPNEADDIYNVAAEARDAAMAPSDEPAKHEGGAKLVDFESAPEVLNKDNTQKLTKSDLNALSTGSLQTIADDLGIDPSQSRSKLAKAILKAQ